MHTKKCLCSKCHLSLFPRNRDDKIILPLIHSNRKEARIDNNWPQTEKRSYLGDLHDFPTPRIPAEPLLPSGQALDPGSSLRAGNSKARSDGVAESSQYPLRVKPPRPAPIQSHFSPQPPAQETADLPAEIARPPLVFLEPRQVSKDGKEVRIRWSNRQTRQEFTSHPSDDGQSPFRHYNVEYQDSNNK